MVLSKEEKLAASYQMSSLVTEATASDRFSVGGLYRNELQNTLYDPFLQLVLLDIFSF